MMKRPLADTISWGPVGVGATMARRRWISATSASGSIQMSWPSGPRWARLSSIARAIVSIRSGEFRRVGLATKPAMPHMLRKSSGEEALSSHQVKPARHLDFRVAGERNRTGRLFRTKNPDKPAEPAHHKVDQAKQDGYHRAIHLGEPGIAESDHHRRLAQTPARDRDRHHGDQHDRRDQQKHLLEIGRCRDRADRAP